MSKSSAKIHYKPVTFDDLPDWARDDHVAAFDAFLRSCPAVIAKSRKAKAKTKTAPSIKAALADICTEALKLSKKAKLAGKKITGSGARKFFESNFEPNGLSYKGPRGILTGYYEPIIVGSRKRQGKFQTPLYTRPSDLVNLVKEKDRAGVGRKLTHAQQTKNGLQPYPTRKQIEQGYLNGKGLELLFLADPVDTFFLHIQGSGVIKLTDGSTARVTYDGKNGRPYSSIGRYLIEKGVIGAKSMSLQALGKWLRADTRRGQEVMWVNKSFIFFRELKGAEAAGAHGVMSVQLSPGRSLAIDARYHNMGMPIYVSAPRLRHVPVGKSGSGKDKNGRGRSFNRLMIGQDVGSAIKGPERGDIFFGTGTEAGKLAGVTKQSGKFYVLLPQSQGSNNSSGEWSAVVKKAKRSGISKATNKPAKMNAPTAKNREADKKKKTGK